MSRMRSLRQFEAFLTYLSHERVLREICMNRYELSQPLHGTTREKREIQPAVVLYRALCQNDHTVRGLGAASVPGRDGVCGRWHDSTVTGFGRGTGSRELTHWRHTGSRKVPHTKVITRAREVLNLVGEGGEVW